MSRRLWLTVAAACVVLVGAWGAVVWSRVTARRVVAYVPGARDLHPEAPVSYVGVEVGRVERVGCSGAVPVATLAIYAADLALTGALRARVRRQGALGSDGVELVVREGPPVPLGRGDTLAGEPPAPLNVPDSALAAELERQAPSRICAQ